MSDIIPEPNVAFVYATASPNMMMRVIDGPNGPGLARLSTLRQLSADADAAISKRIDDEIAARTSGIQSLTTALSSETSLRSAADTKLANDLAAELTARAAADSKLTTDLSAEASTRAAADTALGNRTTALEALTPRRAIITYGGADFTWTFQPAFPAGAVPIIAGLAVGPTTGTMANTLFNVQLVGDPTNTLCKIRVNNVPASTISLLGLTTITLFQQAPSGIKVHLLAYLP